MGWQRNGSGEATMGMIEGTEAYVVNASQESPRATRTPTSPMIRRASVDSDTYQTMQEDG